MRLIITSLLVYNILNVPVCSAKPLPRSIEGHDIKKRSAPSPQPSPPTTMMRVRKQDPAVPALGDYRDLVIYSNVQPGPQDDLVKVAPYPPDFSVGYYPQPGYFLYGCEDATLKEFDYVHSFAVVRNVVLMYNQTLSTLKKPRAFRWQWHTDTHKEPLTVDPRFRYETQNKYTLNARYDRRNKRLAFDVWVPGGDQPFVYLSQSYDIVVHEAGHAVLDGLNPFYLFWAGFGDIDSAALHETFGDLTVIFSLLWQFDVVEQIMVESRGGETLQQGFWNIMGEHFGYYVFGRDPFTQGIRNLNNTLTIDDIPPTAYDGFGVVFTGAVFDSIVEVFHLERQYLVENPALTLYNIGQVFLKIIVQSFLKARVNSKFAVSLKEMAEVILEKTPVKTYKNILKDNFTKRGILVKKTSKKTDADKKKALDKKMSPNKICKVSS